MFLTKILSIILFLVLLVLLSDLYLCAFKKPRLRWKSFVKLSRLKEETFSFKDGAISGVSLLCAKYTIMIIVLAISYWLRVKYPVLRSSLDSTGEISSVFSRILPVWIIGWSVVFGKYKYATALALVAIILDFSLIGVLLLSIGR